MNNILVIIDGHDEKKVFSFSPNLTEQECFDKIKHSMESGVKAKFFFMYRPKQTNFEMMLKYW